MTLLYLDVETIPDIKFKGDIVVSPPGNMSKPETIEQWEKGEGKYAGVKESAIDNEFRKLSFDGTRGQIFCIAWAFDDGEIFSADMKLGSESAALELFLMCLKDKVYAEDGRPETIKWIGHYITGFDLRYIWQRCVINQVKPSIRIPYDAKPWSDNIFDTCIEWKGSGSSSGSRSALCKAFGIDAQEGIDGSEVYDAYLAGEYQKIVDHCRDDVEQVRKMYKMMTFT